MSANSFVPKSTEDAGMRVLVVDDEEKLGRFVCMLLNRVGYYTQPCKSVAEARQLLQNREWHLVITDIVMPQEGGFALVRWVAENIPQLPVIVMTAHSTDAVENQATKLGVSAILHKPFTMDGLRQVVAETVQPLSNGITHH